MYNNNTERCCHNKPKNYCHGPVYLSTSDVVMGVDNNYIKLTPTTVNGFSSSYPGYSYVVPFDGTYFITNYLSNNSIEGERRTTVYIERSAYEHPLMSIPITETTVSTTNQPESTDISFSYIRLKAGDRILLKSELNIATPTIVKLSIHRIGI